MQEEENAEKERQPYFEAYEHYRNAASFPREIKSVSYEELKRELLAVSVEHKQYMDEKTGVSWFVRNDDTPYLTIEQAYQFHQVCGETGAELLQKFNEITGMIRMLDKNTILYMREKELFIENDKKEKICRKLKHFSYDTLMTVLERFPKTEEYMNEAYWEALTAAYHERLEL